MIRIGSAGYGSWEDARSITDPMLNNGAESIYKTADTSEVRCLDENLSEAMVDEIKKAGKRDLRLAVYMRSS